MSLVSAEELLLAVLLEASATDQESGTPLGTVVEEVTGGGDLLSEQVAVAMAVERLIADGDVERQTGRDGVEHLWLTNSGTNRAREIRTRLADHRIEVVEADERRSMAVAELAGQRDESVVTIGAACSSDGVYYAEEPQADGIVDRETHRRVWQEIIERSEQTGEGAVVLLEGPGGIGKTTLADELLAETPADSTVARARCQRASAEPYQPIRQALETIDADDEPFAGAGPTLASGGTADETEPAAVEAQRAGLFHDVTRALASGDGVSVLFLDDIGQSDVATLNYLAYLLETLSEQPIVLLGTHRPETIPADDPLAPGELPDGIEARRRELERFDREQTRELLRRILDRRRLPEEFVEAIFEKTDGTPMFVESTVEALIDSDQLDTQLNWYPEDATEIQLPGAVEQTVLRRIDALDDHVRGLLEWIALASEAVSLDVLERLVDLNRDQLSRSVDVLLEAAVLERTGPDGRVSLQSNVVRETLQEEIDDERGRHRELAEALVAAGPDSLGETDAEMDVEFAATIAYHYERGGVSDQAITWYERATEQAEAIYAHETAIEHYKRILDIARETDEQAVLSAGEGLARVYWHVGRYEQARQYIQFVRERVSPNATTRRQRLATLAARVARGQGEYDRAQAEVEAGLAVDDTPTAHRCSLLLLRARREIEIGEFAAASKTVAEAEVIADTLDDPHLRARCIDMRGLLADSTSDYDAARHYYEDALETFEAAGSRQRGAQVQNKLGLVTRKQGAYAESQSYHESARAQFERIGDRHNVSYTLNNLGLVAWRRSEYDQARDYFEEALEMSQALQDDHGMALTRLNLANVHREQGEYDRAQELYERATPVFEAGGDRHNVAITHHDQGKLANRRGEYERARAHCERALEVYEELGHDHHAAAVQNVLGLTATRTEEYERAREYFETAVELAAAIDNDALVGKIHANWAILSVEQGDGERAVGHSTAARSFLADSHNRWFLGRAWLARARVALERDSPARARESADHALSAFESVDARHGSARARVAVGRACHERGDDGAARDHYEHALGVFEELGASADSLEVLQRWVRLEETTGNSGRAQELAARALDIVDGTDSDYLAELRPWFEHRQPTAG